MCNGYLFFDYFMLIQETNGIHLYQSFAEMQQSDILSLLISINKYSKHSQKIISMLSSHEVARNSTTKKFQLQKTLYPKIRLATNQNRQFLCSDLIPQKYKTLRVSDHRVQFYFAAVKKLLGNCLSIGLKDIWICEKNISVFPILVYFTEPTAYPIMDCCEKCIYIEFDTEFIGAVRCSNCKNCAFSFVRLNKNQSSFYKTRKEGKENNFVQQLQVQEQKQNQKLFKQYKSYNENKKLSVRKLISSNQHRQLSIKKIMGLNDTFSTNATVVTQTKQSKEGRKQRGTKRKKDEILSSNQVHRNCQKRVGSERKETEIEFIIQLQENGGSNWDEQGQQNEKQTECDEEVYHEQTKLSEACQQIKTILEQIFI